MTILVLGATGFLGSWTVRALVARGERPAALIRPTSDPWRIADLSDRIDLHVADVASWGETITSLRPDVLLLLDWAGVAGAAKNDPGQWGNLRRMSDAVHAAALGGAHRVIGVGSQAEYGPHGGIIRENAETAPTTEYGRAKLAARQVLERGATAMDLEWAWARVFSTYGPLDHAHWLLPGIAKALRHGNSVPLTQGIQRWSYLYASDAGRAFATLATAPIVSGVINVGSSDAPPLRDTVERFASHFTPPADLQFGAIEYGPDPVMHLEPELTRLTSLGWREHVSIEDGVAALAGWLQGRDTPDPLLAGSLLPRCPYL